MGKSAEAKYLRHLFCKSCADTWQLVVALPICTFILSVAIAAVTIYLQRRFGAMSHDQMKDAIISLGFGLGAVLIICLFCIDTPFPISDPEAFG